MFINLPGVLSRPGGGGFPPSGTWLSSVCSGPDAHDQGPANYVDANGNTFNGMFTLWQQFANGSGGSYWTSYGNNSSDGRDPLTYCWLPEYFYTASESGTMNFNWFACGNSGNFEYGTFSNQTYANGDGTFTTNNSTNYWYSSGYAIYDSGCCQVFYDGGSGYYYSDNCGGGGGGGDCQSYGTSLGTTCLSTTGYDASGQYWSGVWTYAEIFADGNCGTYYSNQADNTNGCYYPAGYWITYEAVPTSLTYYVVDSCGNGITSGDFVYYIYASGERANGDGSSNINSTSWSAETGTQIAAGTFYDCDGQPRNYVVTYDGNGEYGVQYSS